MIVLITRVVLFFVLVALTPRPAAAEEPATQTCALRVSEAQFDLENHREREHLAPIKLTADQAIFELFEPLWKARLTERIRFLRAKHGRDRSSLLVDRANVATKRAKAKYEVLTRECFSPQPGTEDALSHFVTAGCELVRKDIQIAAVDIAFGRELLESTVELRRLELATVQELIVAKLSLERAEYRLRSSSRRIQDCEPSK